MSDAIEWCICRNAHAYMGKMMNWFRMKNAIFIQRSHVCVCSSTCTTAHALSFCTLLWCRQALVSTVRNINLNVVNFVFRSARSNCIMWIQSPCTNCYIDCWRWHSLLDYEKMYWAQSQKILHRFAWQNCICITQRPFTKNEDHHRSKTKAYHWFNRMDVI